MVSIWRRDGEDVVEVPADGTHTERVLVTVAGVARWRLALVLLLALLNVVVSGVLLLQHHGERRAVAAVGQVCGTGPASGCEVVARSPYSEVRGVPVAAFGLAFSLSLAVLMALGLLGGPDTRHAAAVLGFLLLAASLAAAVVLLGIQLFLIRAFCRLCVLTWAVNALALMALLGARRGGFRGWGGHADTRLALAGWAMTSVALAAGILALERALDLGEEVRAASLPGPLGTAANRPLGPAPALGTEAQRYHEEARAAQEQVRRLQEILDDPRRIEEYYTQKSAREFEQASVLEFDYATAPVKGPPDAPIRVVEFSDFLCPTCRHIAGAFAQYLPQSAGRVAVFHKNYPLDQACNPALQRTVHPGACNLALGAICAHRQGKFWPYHDRVFAQPPSNPGPAEVAALAGAAGLDATAMTACLAAPATQQSLQAEIEEAKKGNVDGTPTLFINGRRLPRLNDFVPTVDREAARMGLPPLPGQRPGGP